MVFEKTDAERCGFQQQNCAERTVCRGRAGQMGPENHNRYGKEKEIRCAVERRAEPRFGMKPACEEAVRRVGNAAQQINAKEPGRKGRKKQKRDGERRAQNGKDVWNVPHRNPSR